MSRPEVGDRVARVGRRSELRVAAVRPVETDGGRELLLELVTGAGWAQLNRGEDAPVHSCLYAADLEALGFHRWRERLVQEELGLEGTVRRKTALEEGR